MALADSVASAGEGSSRGSVRLILPEAFDGVLEAVQNGTISEERLNESVRRILMLKQKAGLELDTRTPLEKMLDVFL